MIFTGSGGVKRQIELPEPRDRLGQAVLKGRFAAVRDEAALSRHLRQLNLQVRQRLGYPRLVHAATADPIIGP